eukprot:CAMPEP_0180340858 /NCGR_PEP_ID=MMETSP0989-20121125/886_1 /TAXON_ID=697907 /ORGANISM="non described non described, Strain CCMP2293" /LENGTH=300 /DNA_ID=CAMNT_0022329595 /DNA_START=91 /DNA_END=989 /DNA_ORIENTATION=+
MMPNQQDQQLPPRPSSPSRQQDLPRSQARRNSAPTIPEFLQVHGASPETLRLQMGPLAAHLAAFEGTAAFPCGGTTVIMMTDQQDQQLPRSQARQNTAPKIPKFLPIRGTSPDTARLQMGPLAAHLAAFEGMEKALVRIAADAPSLLSARNLEGETPAHHAAAAGKHDIIDMLGRIDPKLLMMQDDDGQTPAHTAGMYRHAEVLQAVGRRAPDSFMLLDNSGLSPLDLAGENAECRRAILPFLKVAWPPSPHPPGTRVAPLHSARQSQSMRLMPQPLPPPALLSANLQSAASTPLMPEHA